MGCCADYSEAKTIVENIVKAYHPVDYKIFVARREARGNIIIYSMGVVVLPKEENNAMFKELVDLQSNSSTDCIKIKYSQVDLRDSRMVDLFILDIEVRG